jgi:hypothetical protein
MWHPNIVPFPTVRSVLIYSPEAYLRQWMEVELVETGATVQVAKSMDGVLAALIYDPPPRPQVLVIDVDCTRAAELARLEGVYAGGWRGRVIGIGDMEIEMRLDHHLVPPYRTGDLRAFLRNRLPARGSTPHQHRTQRIAISSLRDHLG